MTRIPYTTKLCDMKHDTGPAESEYPDEHDDTPIIAPDSLASAMTVLVCIVGFAILAAVLLLT